MKQHAKILVGLAAAALLATGTVAMAEEQGKAATTQSEQHSDKEAAARYVDEAAQLRAKAQSHRALAKQYRARTGKNNFAQIAAHCEKLAKFYEDAAQEAEAISSGLSK